MSLADACTILRAASACPVRLTLLRQRQQPQGDDRASSIDVDLDKHQHLAVGGLEPSRSSSPEFDGRLNVPGAAGVHSTYIDLSTAVAPTTQSSEQWNDEDSLSPPAAFYKTQSSPTLEKIPDIYLSTTFATASSSHRLAQSVDKLYTSARRREDSDSDDEVGRIADNSLSSSDAVDKNDGQLEKGNPTVDASSHLEGFHPHDEEVSTNASEPALTNRSKAFLLQESTSGLRGGRPLQTAVEDADLTGVERAMRAPERSAAGGLAFYINLEDHHFNGFPEHRRESRAHSADDLRTS